MLFTKHLDLDLSIARPLKALKILSDTRVLPEKSTLQDLKSLSGRQNVTSTKADPLDIHASSTSKYSETEVSEGLNISPVLLSPTVSTQTASYLSSCSPRKQKGQIRKMKKVNSAAKVRQKQRQLQACDFNTLCDKFLGYPSKRHSLHRYSMELKQFALTLFFKSQSVQM